MRLRTAVLRVIVVSSLFWGALFLALYWQKRHREERAHDPRWTVHRIASRPLTQDRLPLSVLAELLHLNADHAQSLFSFRPAEVALGLQECPAIEKARVWRLLPGTLGVEYALREPIALLAGVKNVALDASGKLFFLFPFFAPKRLPAVVFPPGSRTTPLSLVALQRSVLSSDVSSSALDLVRQLAQIGEREHLFLDLVDLSQINHPTLFRREVTIAFTSIARNEKLYVRLDPITLPQRMGVLPRILHACLKNGFQPGIIDMRFEGYAICSQQLVKM